MSCGPVPPPTMARGRTLVPPGQREDTAGSLTLVATPVPAVLGVILPHVLDEVGLLQALVPGRPGYVLGSVGEKQVVCPCWTLCGPE